MKKISNAEMDIMKLLWEHQDQGLHFRDIFRDVFRYREDKQECAKQTVNTFIKRLVSKGYIREVKEPREYRRYIPAVTRAEYILRVIEDVYGKADEKVLRELKEGLKAR